MSQEKRELLFLSNPILRDSVADRLETLETVAKTGSPQAITILAMSAFEAIVDDVFEHTPKEEIQSLQGTPAWPRDPNNAANEKALGSFKTRDKAQVLSALNRLPTNILPESAYRLLWGARNRVHIAEDVKIRQANSDDVITAGVAHAARAALQLTIEHQLRNRHWDGSTWTVVQDPVDFHTEPTPYGGKAIDFRPSPTERPHYALTATSGFRNVAMTLRFDLHMSPQSLFGFVYNFESRDKFVAIRIDNRMPARDQGLLVVENGWGSRGTSVTFTPATEPRPQDLRYHVEITLPKSGPPELKLNGTLLRFSSSPTWRTERDYDSKLGIGFLAELRPVVMNAINFK